MKPLIIFTGGGSAGHVTPNIAIIKKLPLVDWDMVYIGSEHGIEKNLIDNIHIHYYAIKSGKLRRYFSWQNFIDPFKVLWGILQAYSICRKLKPNLVFSKGGFIAFPVVFAAWLNKIPVIIHESDLTPGLANRLCFPFAKRILVTFAETQNHCRYPNKVQVVGTPIRPELLHGDANRGRQFCGFTAGKPIILIIGGSLGATNINRVIRDSLTELLQHYQLIHICGKNNVDTRYSELTGYQQFEYIDKELADLFACANLVISRAGANALYELLALKKLNILIPLSKQASRGDQIINAAYFEKKGFSRVIPEEQLSSSILLATIQDILLNKAVWQQRLDTNTLPDSLALIQQEIMAFC